MTTIILIGERAEGGLTHSLERALLRLGYGVSWIAWPPPTLSQRQSRMGLSVPAVLGPQRRLLANELAERQPTLTVVVKGAFLTPRFIRWAGSHTTGPIVCWNPDSPFDHSISNSGGGIRGSIGEYSLYVTWSDDVARQIRQAGQTRTAVIPFGWDDELHRPPLELDRNLLERPVFVGTWTPQRERWLRPVAAMGLVVFGNGWDPRGKMEVRQPVYGPNFARVVGSAGVSINLLRGQNEDSHNMRTFETPGVGGIQVAPSTADHRRYLESHALLFTGGPKELRAAVELSLSTQGAVPRRTPRWLHQHRYVERAGRLLDLAL